MRQLTGTKAWYRRAYAAPLAQLISGCVQINAYPCLIPLRDLCGAICDLIFYHGGHREHEEVRNAGNRVMNGLVHNL